MFIPSSSVDLCKSHIPNMSARVKFDVGGQIYSISLAALQNGPSSKLTQMYSSGRNVSESGHHEIDRPADMFASVLALYQTGELHFPVTSCPGAFLSELEFWEIAPEVVASCCYERYVFKPFLSYHSCVCI